MKKLIYFTIGNNKQYISLLDFCVKSLHKVNYDGDYLIICNDDYEKSILEVINFKDNKVYFFETSNNDLKLSSANKLKIYNYPLIEKYDKILYCDADMLWIKHPNDFFDVCNENKIYIANEGNGLMTHSFYGGGHFSDTESEKIIKNNIFGCNAGLFIFNKNMINDFMKIDEYYQENQNLMGSCLEQPYINAYLFRTEKYDTSITNKILQNSYNEPPQDLRDISVIHFLGVPGNFTAKYNSMKRFYENRL